MSKKETKYDRGNHFHPSSDFSCSLFSNHHQHRPPPTQTLLEVQEVFFKELKRKKTLLFFKCLSTGVSRSSTPSPCPDHENLCDPREFLSRKTIDSKTTFYFLSVIIMISDQTNITAIVNIANAIPVKWNQDRTLVYDSI